MPAPLSKFREHAGELERYCKAEPFDMTLNSIVFCASALGLWVAVMAARTRVGMRHRLRRCR
jgi:hypothetical protein